MMQKVIKNTTMLVVGLGLAGVGYAGSLSLPAPGEVYFAPDTTSVLHFKAKDMGKDTVVNYVVRDYQDKEVARSQSTVAADGSVDIPVKFPAGYYEVVFPQTSQTIGMMAMAKYTGKPDMFFGMDSAYSWFPGGAQEQDLMNALKRNGVAVVRERLSWKEIGEDVTQPTWTAGQGNRYLSVRKREAAAGLKVLEVFHDAPASTGSDMNQRSPARFPQDLTLMNRDWLIYFGHLSPYLSGIEAWNEPDDKSGPSADYVPLAKALAWTSKEQGCNTPIVGGVVSEMVSAQFREGLGTNRMMDVVDAISYHSYADPTAIERTMVGYRGLLKRYDQEPLPVYITESGWPWKAKGTRPDIKASGDSARSISMKAVEGRACGIAQYYPFIGQYYKEGESNFSMMDDNKTPQRSMAGYVKAASTLSNLDYIGDLKHNDATIKRARVFSDGVVCVAVLYTLPVEAGSKVKLNAPVTAIQGIDGRALNKTADGSIPVPDGMTYLMLDAKAIAAAPAKYIDKNTVAMRLWNVSRQELAPRQVSPIVIQPMLKAEQLECAKKRSSGYFVKNDSLAKFKVPVRINNLSKQPLNVNVKIELPAGAKLVEGEAVEALTFSAKSATDMEWAVDLSKVLTKNPECSLRVVVTGEDGSVADYVHLPLYNASMAVLSYFAMHAATPPEMNAALESKSWEAANVIKLVTKDTDEQNLAAMVVKGQFMWDNSGLYFRFKLRDQVHAQEESPMLCWRQDSIQLAFDPKFARTGDADQFEYGISLKGNDARWVCWLNGQKKTAELSPLTKLCIKRYEAETMTVYEGRLAWADLMPFQPEKGKFLGMTFCVNNCDGGQSRTMLEWTEGIAGSKDPGMFAKVVLE